MEGDWEKVENTSLKRVLSALDLIYIPEYASL